MRVCVFVRQGLNFKLGSPGNNFLIKVIFEQRTGVWSMLYIHTFIHIHTYDELGKTAIKF
jgi:hypothetical protein